MSVTARPLGSGLPPALRALVERHQSQRARTTADQSVARRIKAALTGVGLAAGLAVYVHDGAVSLYGTVADGAAREAVVSAVAGLPGVRRIVDHLRLAEA